jgi:hypothetical protein
MRKSVGQVPKAGEQTQQKPCRTSSDIGTEEETYTVGRGPMFCNLLNLSNISLKVVRKVNNNCQITP